MKKNRKPRASGGCIVMPGSAADREINRAWREGRVIPMNAAALRNATSIYGAMGMSVPDLPKGLRPGDKVGKR
jgi:hypothetical protein